MEKSLQTRLLAVSRTQLTEGEAIQNISDVVTHVRRQQQTFKSKVEEVKTLMDEMKRLLEEAKTRLQSVVRRHEEHVRNIKTF